MTGLQDKTVCIVDNGLFIELAITLSKSFGRTFYLSSWITGFPRSNSLVVGTGIEGVERIGSIWPVLDDVDLFVFPDIYHGPMQIHLRKMGKRVWGSGLAESLEINRANSKKWLKQMGLPVGPHQIIKGLANLRRHLEKNADVYVKSETRGDMETFHSKSYDLIEPRLDELGHFLGARQHDYPFIVEEPIATDVELGYDGFTIDGRFPKQSLFGYEVKDTAYLGEVRQYKELPSALTFVNQKLAPLFRDLQYRGFWSSEVRFKEVPYLIDPCCRMASPPGELYQLMIENLAEVMWFGAEGEMVQPKWSHKWGAELIIKSEWAEAGWQPLEIPKEHRENLKVHYLAQIGGHPYYVPQQIPIPEVAAVVAGGDTADEAIKAVKKIAEKVKGYDIHHNAKALDDAKGKMT